jgi:hypothetical protein
MTRFASLAVAGLLAVVAPAPDVVAQEQPLQLLESLGRALRGQALWRASYHQSFVPAGMTLGEEVDGVVWLSWPDRALFHAGDPVLRLMGLEGRSLRLVDLEVAGCDDHQLSDDEWARIPLAAVLDPQIAVDRFTVLALPGRGFALQPREAGGVARVEVGLGTGDLPEFVVVIDPQGATNRLDFSGWSTASSVPEGRWLPAPPAGVACISDTDD